MQIRRDKTRRVCVRAFVRACVCLRVFESPALHLDRCVKGGGLGWKQHTQTENKHTNILLRKYSARLFLIHDNCVYGRCACEGVIKQRKKRVLSHPGFTKRSHRLRLSRWCGQPDLLISLPAAAPALRHHTAPELSAPVNLLFHLTPL